MTAQWERADSRVFVINGWIRLFCLWHLQIPSFHHTETFLQRLLKSGWFVGWKGVSCYFFVFFCTFSPFRRSPPNEWRTLNELERVKQFTHHHRRKTIISHTTPATTLTSFLSLSSLAFSLFVLLLSAPSTPLQTYLFSLLQRLVDFQFERIRILIKSIFENNLYPFVYHVIVCFSCSQRHQFFTLQ